VLQLQTGWNMSSFDEAETKLQKVLQVLMTSVGVTTP
jgi:hypothetical protein